MMHGPALAERLRIEFALRSEARAIQRDKEKVAERKERQREDELERHEAQALEDQVAAVVMTSEITDFAADLDRYDTATVEALQLNGEELARVQARIDDLLGEATVLPDGRRVFKTRDGQRVFDEFGHEVKADIVEPDQIDDYRPHWEEFKGEIDARDALKEERADILDYQERLDEARKRLDAGDISRAEFERLRKDLRAEMLDAVRERLEEKAPAHQAALDLDLATDSEPSAPKAAAQALQL